MNTSANKILDPVATSVQFDEFMMRVRLGDGREISVPLEWFPRLRNASPEQREHWRLIGRGVGIHWEDIDEDISVPALLYQDKPTNPCI